MTQRIEFFLTILPALLFIILPLTGCAKSEDAQSPISRIKVGNSLDIPVLEGSRIPDTCKLEIIASDIKMPSGCVVMSVASEGVNEKDWDSDYLRALQQNGWEFAGGEANVYYLEKKKSEDCSFSLSMMAWIYGNDEVMKSYGTQNESEDYDDFVFYFLLDNNEVCGSERKLSRG